MLIGIMLALLEKKKEGHPPLRVLFLCRQNSARSRSLSVPGLFFMGLSYQRTYASATLRGAGSDAAVVVRQIQRWLKTAA